MSSEESGKKNIIICRCEDVTLEEVEKVIEEGYTTLEEIKRILRCGTGACQGRTCLRLIMSIISRKTGKPVSEIELPRIRPPIRPVPVALFAIDEHKKD